MIVRWTEKAFLSLEQISHHLSEDNVDVAARTLQSVYERIEELVIFPNRGRIGRRKGTRELVLSPLPYIAIYRLKESTIEILQIRHGAQSPN